VCLAASLKTSRHTSHLSVHNHQQHHPTISSITQPSAASPNHQQHHPTSSSFTQPSAASPNHQQHRPSTAPLKNPTVSAAHGQYHLPALGLMMLIWPSEDPQARVRASVS